MPIFKISGPKVQNGQQFSITVWMYDFREWELSYWMYYSTTISDKPCNKCFKKMDDLLIQNHTKPPTSPNGCSSKNYSSNHPCCNMAGAAFKYVPQTAATTFIPSLLSDSSPMGILQWKGTKGTLKTKLSQKLKKILKQTGWTSHLLKEMSRDLYHNLFICLR